LNCGQNKPQNKQIEHRMSDNEEYLSYEIHDLVMIYKRESGKTNIEIYADAFERKLKKRPSLRDLHTGKWSKENADGIIFDPIFRAITKEYIEAELGKIYAENPWRLDLKRFAVKALRQQLDI